MYILIYNFYTKKGYILKKWHFTFNYQPILIEKKPNHRYIKTILAKCLSIFNIMNRPLLYLL